ncbi:MAG: tetratricopeptide repeat protein [Parachlamydiaceae bacterium]|nr:tetratricopeptide repeat protein [Parachlamydiaceae bacterium]
MKFGIAFLQFCISTCLFYCQELDCLTKMDGYQQAERLFDEKLYDDASHIYERCIKKPTTSDFESKDSIILKLADCYLKLGKNQETIELLTSNRLESSENNAEKNFRLAVAYRQIGQYQNALSLLTSPIFNENNVLKDEINLEIGINSFYLNNPSTLTLQSIKWDQAKPELYYLAQIYLARQGLKNGNLTSIQQDLDSLQKRIPRENPLNFEIAYLKGMASFLDHEYVAAATQFEQAIPTHNADKCPWYQETLYLLGNCYLNQAADLDLSKEEVNRLANKSLNFLQAILPSKHDEKFNLTLAELYLLQTRRLQNSNAYESLNQLISNKANFPSQEGIHQALLLQIAASPTYEEREYIYKQMVQKDKEGSPFYSHAWYLRGMNQYEEALKLYCNIKPELNIKSDALLEMAADSFHHSSQLYKQSNTANADQALKLQALAYFHQTSPTKKRQAWDLLVSTIQSKKNEVNSGDVEFYYIAALIGASLLNNSNDTNIKKIEEILLDGLKLETAIRADKLNPKWQETILKTLGLLYFQQSEFSKAKDRWAQLLSRFPQSNLCSESLFWIAKCEEQQKDFVSMKASLQKIYLNDPKSPFAPRAYFNYYSNREYMRGNRKALKHLQAMPSLFPDQPVLISAYYLIGLDNTKDHLTDEGKVVHHKNLTGAIDAFQLSESTYDSLFKRQLIPENELAYFTQVRYRSNLERALANLAIAKESEGAKRHIYLEYAAEVFGQIQQDFHSNNHLMKNSYPEILEENEFHLAQVYLEKGQKEEAIKIFDHMLDHYKETPDEDRYYLYRLWLEKGKLAQNDRSPEEALQCFNKAENVYKNLSPDEKLELWIQQSSCYKDNKNYDDAMRILSKVVNDEAISGLRVKAMFLRAEIYELQGKPELAVKQLEATSKKGGEWGQKAREKLTQQYEYR